MIDKNEQYLTIGAYTALDMLNLFENNSGGSGGKFIDGDDPNDAVYTDGNVGIGLTNPTEKLDVNGNVKVSDTLILSGSDVNEIMFYEKHISNDYTVTSKSENIIIENLTSDIIITLPAISSNNVIHTNWRIIKNDDSNYKVYISLEDPNDSIFGNQFHTLILSKIGEGIEIYCNESNKYSYAKYDGLFLTTSIPIVSTISGDLSGTNLVLNGNIDDMGFNTSVEVYFRYREEGTSIWTYTTAQVKTTIGSFADTVVVSLGVKYELQAILKDNKNILFYGNIILSSSWIDLRLNGAVVTDGNGAGNDIRYRNGMTMGRDATGMYFSGNNPWRSWVKFEFMSWTRGENKTLQWIFTRPSTSMMIGIGSDATNETSTSQYSQGEVQGYFNSSTSFYGLYGNSGIIGNGTNQATNTDISGGTGVFKIKFTNDGTINQSVFTLYELPSANESDWSDENNILVSITNTAIGADELNLMPFIIPINGGTQRFIAIKLK